MGSSYFREPNMGNERGGGSSSRKSKKNSNNSDKPKQPQRGLGVAQLEKIRLHGQLGCNYLPSIHGPYPSNFTQEDLRAQAAYTSLPSSSSSSSSFSYSPSSSASSSSYSFHPSMMMGVADYDQRTNIRYGDSLPFTGASCTTWNPGSSNFEAPYYAQPSTSTRHFLNPPVEDTQQTKNKKHRSDSAGSSSHNSESSDVELDLELRL